MQNVVEAAEERRIKYSRVIRCRDDEAVRAVLLDHLQEAVQHSANLAHIVGESTLRTDSVELVEEVDATCSACGIEYLS